MLWGSSMLSEFFTSLSKVLTLWRCVNVKQRYHRGFFQRIKGKNRQNRFSSLHENKNDLYVKPKDRQPQWQHHIDCLHFLEVKSTRLRPNRSPKNFWQTKLLVHLWLHILQQVQHGPNCKNSHIDQKHLQINIWLDILITSNKLGIWNLDFSFC